MYVALRVPPAPRATVRPLPLMSPALKLIVDVDGVAAGTGPRKTDQEKVSLRTVTLPVTAMAVARTLPRPVTWKVAGVLATSLALRPLPTRVSSRREGAIGMKTAPVESAV